jgi:hypothetical protein
MLVGGVANANCLRQIGNQPDRQQTICGQSRVCRNMLIKLRVGK